MKKNEMKAFGLYIHDEQAYGYVKGMGDFYDCRVKCAIGPNCESFLDNDLKAPCGGGDLYLVKLEDVENE